MSIKAVGETAETSKYYKDPAILVLGGYGFIGRYTVAALGRRNARVVIGTRGLKGHKALNKLPLERRICLHHHLDAGDWTKALAGIDVVINSVGILRERRGETFSAVHHKAVQALSIACARQKIPLIHVSALGIDGPIKNEFSLSKRRGEEAMLASGCEGAIVRASVVDATDGYGSGWFHRVAQWPVWVLPGNALKKISPIKAADLGEALAILALESTHQESLPKPATLVEVGCGETFTLEGYLLRLRRGESCLTKKPLLTVRIPQTVARLFARLFDLLRLTPYSIGHHELLEFDNVPEVNSLPGILGRSPGAIAAATTLKRQPGLLGLEGRQV